MPHSERRIEVDFGLLFAVLLALAAGVFFGIVALILASLTKRTGSGIGYYFDVLGNALQPDLIGFTAVSFILMVAGGTAIAVAILPRRLQESPRVTFWFSVALVICIALTVGILSLWAIA